MHEDEQKTRRFPGALLLGFFFYLFILAYDFAALFLNSFKRRLSIPTLTDYRKSDESRLDIPEQATLEKTELFVNKDEASSANRLTYTLPPLPSTAQEVLLEVYLNVEPELSLELELILSGNLTRDESETIFLFAGPFEGDSQLHYPASRLWFTLPNDHQLVLHFVDAQPQDGAAAFENVKLRILDWR